MNLDQWISCISEAHRTSGETLSPLQEMLLKLPSGENTDKSEITEDGIEFGIKYGHLPMEVKSQNKAANKIIEEEIEIVKRYFFKKAVVGETFGLVSRIKEKSGFYLEENYDLSSGPFINMAKTYWTFQIEVKDLFPKYYDLALSQVLANVETNIASAFFPTPGPVVMWVRQRREIQRQLLEQYAPEIDIKAFLENNPFLGTSPGRIAKKVSNEKIWVRCFNHKSPQFLRIPNIIKAQKVRCPKCKISFRFPAKDLKWLDQLLPHLHPDSDKIEKLEELRRHWSIPEEVFSLHVISSHWAISRLQEYGLLQFQQETPQASEKELWKKVLESRMITQQMYDFFSERLDEKEIEEIVHEANSFEELCDLLIEFEEKNVMKAPLADIFGIGEKIDEILSG